MTQWSRSRRPGILAGLLFPCLAGCSALDVINHLSPDRSFDATSDVPYGPLPRQRLDIYQPTGAEGAAPLVVFFYGGGWRNGSKADYEFIASAMTDAGIAVAIPDYRLFPDVSFPAFVEDGAAALAWLVENARDYGIDTNRIFVMGHSAGAHIAACIALDPTYLRANGLERSTITGFIGLSGPYDFLPIESGYLLDVFPASTREQSQPINLVSAAAPPTLLIHGTSDSTVRIANSRKLERRLHAAGVPVEFRAYNGASHARVVMAIAPPLGFLGSTLVDSQAFVWRTLGIAAAEE